MTAKIYNLPLRAMAVPAIVLSETEKRLIHVSKLYNKNAVIEHMALALARLALGADEIMRGVEEDADRKAPAANAAFVLAANYIRTEVTECLDRLEKLEKE